MKNAIIALFISASVFSVSASPSRAELPDGVADVVLGGLDEKLNNIIARAEAAGDHLIKQLALSAKELIHAWEKSNTNLLNTAFSGIDQSTRQVFNNIDELADRIIEGETILMQDAEMLTAEFSGIVKSLPMTDKQPEVYSYGPKVLPMIGTDVVRFSIVGPRLGTSNPTGLINGEPVSIERPSDNMVVAVVDRSKLSFGTGNSIFAQLRLDFDDQKPGWWDQLTGVERNRLQREMAVWLLPTVAANWNLAQAATRTSRQTMTTQVTVSGRGKDSPYHVAARIPPHILDDGWRLDQDLLVSWASGANPGWQAQGPADHGTCAGLVPGTTSPEGFTYNIQMGHVTKRFEKKDAWGSCTLTLPMFRDVSTVEDLPLQEGAISWTDDVVINLDPTVQNWQLELTRFDGRTFIMTPLIPAPPSEIAINAAGGQIHMRPRTPRGF